MQSALSRPEAPAWQSARALIRDLGMPCSLRDVAITRDNLEELATRALDYQPVLLNPRKIVTTADVMEIREVAY